MATSGLINTNMGNNATYYVIEWSRTGYSVADNTSTISWKVSEVTASYIGASATLYYTLAIDNNTYSFSGKAGTHKGDVVVLGSGSAVISHNADGSKAFSITLHCSGKADYSYSALKASGMGELDSIPRPVTITSAPNFNDEENPKISYNNPSKDSSGITSLTAYIALTESGTKLVSRTLDKTAKEYTFVLTDAERKTLRQYVTIGNSRTLVFVVETVTNGASDTKTHRSSVSKTFTLVNHTPTLTPTIIDVNPTTVGLTGNNKKLVRYLSNAQVTVGAQGRKEASIVSRRVINGSKTIEIEDRAQDVVTINGIDSHTFYLSATDSRYFTTETAVNLRADLDEYIEYVKLTNYIDYTFLNSTGVLNVRIAGKYFNGSFGAKNNTMEVDYRLTDEDGNIITEVKDQYGNTIREYAILSNVTPTMTDDTSYTYSFNVSGLNYSKQYTLEVWVQDEIGPALAVSKVLSAKPTFDWNKTDFRHHTNVHLDNNGTLRSYLADGTDIQIMGVNTSNTLTIGWGGYDTGKGNTNVYGNNVLLQGKGEVRLLGNTRLDKGKIIYGTKPDGTAVAALEPCNASGNLTLGYGGFADKTGETNIYGDSININANKTIKINGREFSSNSVLWSGSNQMANGTTITLNKGISTQMNGIVLIFSYYEPSTGYAQDVGWNSFFVSRYGVSASLEGGHTFLMGLNAGFSLIGAKYLTFTDTTISGHTSNTQTGTNSGITFKNNQFCLRYVIGV